MTEHVYWKNRCGADKSGGGRCLLPAKASYGGHCYLHGSLEEAHEPAPPRIEESKPDAPWCKTLNASGWPCRSKAAVGAEHCWNHLRGVLRAKSRERIGQQVLHPQPCRPCVARGEPCAQHRPSDARTRKLELECGTLRLQVRELEAALDRAYAELDLVKAMAKPPPVTPLQRANGKAWA